MFSRNDLVSLDYFIVLASFNEDLELYSKNTGHCWKLVYEHKSYTLYHKHQINDDYHYQTIIGSLYDTVLYIVSHDEYQLRGRKRITRKEELRRGSLFFDLLNKYGTTA